MVTSFSAEKYNLSGPELARVTARVKEGDLTHVLKIYESELKSPLKSAVSGSLIRALLIQIQKAKVDLEVAMSGIDRLLKSQELLFGAVGIAPAMGVLYVCGSWFKNQLADATGRGKKAASAKVRVQTWEAMRRIDRLLSLPPSGEAYDGSDNQHSSSGAGAGATPLPALTQGLLLLDLSLLRAISTPLLSRASGSASTSKRLRREFLQDVRDLEGAGQGHGRHHSHGQSREMRGGAGGRREGGSGAGAGAQSQTGLGWEARKAAMERMWRSWSSLFSVDGFA